jgi:hypothetical protein
MNVAIFWDIALCSPYVNRRFGGRYHPISPATCCSLLFRLIFEPRDGNYTFLRNVGSHIGLHGAISKNMATFITTAVRTSNFYKVSPYYYNREYTRIFDSMFPMLHDEYYGTIVTMWNTSKIPPSERGNQLPSILRIFGRWQSKHE